MSAPPDFIRTEADRAKLIDALSRDEDHQFRVDRNSATWRAVRQEIKRLSSTDYMQVLRNKAMDHGQTQYARGAMDALDCLLAFGGDEV